MRFDVLNSKMQEFWLTAPHNTAQHSRAPQHDSTARQTRHSTEHRAQSTEQHRAAQQSTIQHNTTPHHTTAQHSTTQLNTNTTQHSAVLCCVVLWFFVSTNGAHGSNESARKIRIISTFPCSTFDAAAVCPWRAKSVLRGLENEWTRRLDAACRAVLCHGVLCRAILFLKEHNTCHHIPARHTAAKQNTHGLSRKG